MDATDRVYIDCREYPSDNHCGLKISGSQVEVMETAILHAVARHGMHDSPDFRRQLKELVKADKEP